MSFHFGRFLQEAIQTQEQEIAYKEICEYLDNVQFDIPEDLKNHIDENFSLSSAQMMKDAELAVLAAIEDPKKRM